jgi:group I intron endonuclease
MDCGVYKISSPSGKCYVGSSVRIRKRWRDHKRQLELGIHHCIGLQAACNKYGIDKLVFEVIEKCEKVFLFEREQHYIDTLNSAYNTARFANRPFYGQKLSEDHRKKIGEANRTSDAAKVGRVIGAMKRRKCSFEEIELIVKDYKGGMTYNQLAERHGVSQVTILRYVRESGYKKPRKWPQKKKKETVDIVV